jgi:catechol 2,3-dioxygenase-like lactoylglutathione lyase family enzyme
MRIEIRGMAPLISVYDMPRALRFYRDVLGFEVVSTNAEFSNDRYDWVLMRLGDAELMLNTMFEADVRPAHEDARRIAAHEDTGFFFGCPDVDAAYAYLRERGVPAEPPKVADYGMKQLYVRDPDGYNLCFQWPVS